MTIYNIPDIEVLADIDDLMDRHRSTTISVYAEAEKIRRKWPDRNIALEDIVALLVARSGEHRAGLLFNPDEAADALMGCSPEPSLACDPSFEGSNDNRESQESTNIISLRSKNAGL